jgi:hypothetical protein
MTEQTSAQPLPATGDTLPVQGNIHNERFEQERDLLERRQGLAESRLGEISERVERYNQRHREKTGQEPNGQYDGSLISAQAGIVHVKNRLEFLRPSSDQDVAYRERLMDQLPEAISRAAPPELPLRFHGTSIWNGRDSLIAGNLSSSVDRLGVETSMDVGDQVSVAKAPDVRICTDGYMDLEQYNVPPGCLFVTMPSSAEDAAAGRSLLMGNVDFKNEDPRRLFAVATGSESVAAMKEWAEAGGVDPDKIMEYFEFAEKLGQLKEQIAAGEVNSQDLVPYQLPDGFRD